MKSFGDWFNDLEGSIEDASEIKKSPQLTPKDDLYNAAIAASLSNEVPSNRLVPPQYVLDKLPAGAKILGVYEGVALGAASPIWVGIDNKGFCITILGDDEDDIWTTHSPNQKTEEQIVADIKNVADEIGTIWHDYTPDVSALACVEQAFDDGRVRMFSDAVVTTNDTGLGMPTLRMPEAQSPEEVMKASVTPLQIRAMFADLELPNWEEFTSVWFDYFLGDSHVVSVIGEELARQWYKVGANSDEEVEFVSKLRDDIYNGRVQ